MPKINMVRLVDLAKLPKLLMLDNWLSGTGAFYALGLFGAFVTGPDGKPQFTKTSTCGLAHAVRLKSTYKLDSMLANLFIAAAKHTRHYRTLPKKHSKYGDTEYWLGDGVTSTCWGDYYFTVDGPNEEVGRVCWDGSLYGGIIYSPGRVGVVKFR